MTIKTETPSFSAKQGRAGMQLQDLSAEKLAAMIGGLDRATLAVMADKARKLAKPEATRQVADICEALAEGSGVKGQGTGGNA